MKELSRECHASLKKFQIVHGTITFEYPLFFCLFEPVRISVSMLRAAKMDWLALLSYVVLICERKACVLIMVLCLRSLQNCLAFFLAYPIRDMFLVVLFLQFLQEITPITVELCFLGLLKYMY